MSWSLTTAPSSKTLWIAWAVEGACVGIGFMLALVIGFEAGGLGVGLLAGAPFAAAAVVEFGRIPLVRGFFSVRGAFWKMLTLVAILLAGTLTTENLIFGFERAFAVRIQEVSQQSQRAIDAMANKNSLGDGLKQLIAQRDTVQTEINQLIKENETDQGTANKSSDRAEQANTNERTTALERQQELDRDRTAMLALHKNQLAYARRVCRTDPKRCRLGVLLGQQQRELAALDKKRDGARLELENRDDAYNQERAQVSDNLQTRQQALKTRRAPLDARLDELNTKIDKAQTDLSKATGVANELDAVAQSARRASQMHRLARFFFGSDDDAAAIRMLGWFSIVSAIVLSTAGSILAATHFRSVTQSTTSRSNSLARSIRGWLARQRLKHSVVKKVEVVREVEVPVDRVVDRTVEVVKPELVLVPVPLEAKEEERRRIMARAAQAHGIGTNDQAPFKQAAD